MPRKKFRCTKCDRSFSMKAHLVRHSTSKHGVGGKKRLGRPPGSGVKKRLGRPPGSGRKRSFAQAAAVGTGTDMDGFVSNLHAYRDRLLEEQRTLATQLDAMDRAIGAMTGAAPAASRASGRRKPGRPRGSRSKKGTLATVIATVLRSHSGPMSPAEISKGVTQAGYKSKAKDLTKAVSNALPSIKAIKRLGFGKYRI